MKGKITFFTEVKHLHFYPTVLGIFAAWFTDKPILTVSRR